jgi:SAM-dependent methyltransferase
MPARSVTRRINWILDNLVPPILRDSRWFMMPLFWLVFGKKAGEFARFKGVAPSLSATEYRRWYERLADSHIQRESDLTPSVVSEVLRATTGDSVLDVGCGRGFLTRQLAAAGHRRVVGIDLHVPPARDTRTTFLRGDGEALPFADRAFDTVTCCHVLEHVLDPVRALTELRRVARRRLILVFPRQREYTYTFDLHIRFFPYAFSVRQLTRKPDARCELVENDFLYVEDLPESSTAHRTVRAG